MSAAPGKRDQLYSVTDAAYSQTRILTIDAKRTPAVITAALPVRDAAGAPVGYDAEGIFARPQGGFWLAVEGAKGAENKLVRLDAAGLTRQTVALPAEVAAGLGKQGLEGSPRPPTGRAGRSSGWPCSGAEHRPGRHRPARPL
ncbi:esterase-like activity of phytase family protein [Micromonospora sp. M12]